MSGQLEKLYRMQKKDIPKSGAVLADAFQHDPVWNNVFAGGAAMEQRKSVFETPVRYSLMFGEAYATSEKLEGIVAWVPGDLADMTAWRMIRSGAIWSGMRIGAKLLRRMEPVNKPLQSDRKENMRGSPFLYLQIFGVASEFQRQGFGGKLLRALIEKSEQAGIPIYLETETEPNVRMYEKFGFRLLKEISLPVIDLPMWEMAREPQA